MSGAKEMRLKYGLTQEQFALYLNITTGLLKMIEIGRRELPMAALLKLNKLALHELPLLPTEAIGEPNAKIEKKKKALRWEKDKLERKLEQMRKKYQDAVNGLAMAQHFLQLPIADKGEQLMLEMLEISSKQALKKYSLEEQEYLAWQIGWLEKMAK